MERYKVAIISDCYLPRIGGLELHMRDLARELNARGHEAHVVCLTPGGGSTAGITVHRLPAQTPRWLQPLRDLAFPPVELADPYVGMIPWLQSLFDHHVNQLLEDVLRRGGYNMVHVLSCYSPLAHAGTFLAKRIGIPSVFTEHAVLRGLGVRTFRAINRVIPWTTWPTVLSAVSNYVAEDVRMISGRDDVMVLPNGIHPEEWHVPRSDPAQPHILHVGRFTARKQQIDLIHAIPKVLAALPPGVEPRFTLVGDGSQRRRVEREARRLKLERYVEFPGMLSREQIRELLGRATVFVLPSEKEALPISLLEARAAGVPVVARTPNGASDIITPGREGFLARSLDDFARAIATIIMDATLRRRMGENGRKQMDRFCWDHVIRRHMEVYRVATERFHGLPARDLRTAIA